MKSSIVFAFFIILTAGVFAESDYLNSYEIIPEFPKPGEPFKIRLKGWWPNPCVSAVITPSVYQSEIYIDIYVTPNPEPCAQVVTPWTYDVTIPAQEKELYSIDYRFRSSDPQYNKSGKSLGYAPVGLPDIQTCVVGDGIGKLKTGGGITGTGLGNFNVAGSFSFADTGNGGWLTDVDLHAINDSGEQSIDMAKLFGLTGAAIYFDNYMYTGETYYDGGKAAVTLVVDPAANGYHISGTITPGCCDRTSYTLYSTFCDITKHSVCMNFPAADLNKDCKVNLKDFAIMASEWMSCQLLDEEDCWQ